MRALSNERLLRYGVAVASIVLATTLRLLLNPLFGDLFPFATLFFAVLVTAWFGGTGPALLAAVLGALGAASLLLAPHGTFAIHRFEDQAGMVLYLTVSAGIAFLGGAMQQAKRRAEATVAAALQEQEKLRTTLQSIGDAIIVTDAAGRVTALNPVAETLTGWTATAAIGQPLATIFHIVNEQTRQPVESPVTKVLRDGVIVGLANHTILIARDGTERPIDDSAAPIRWGSGGPAGVVLVFRDVTERRRAEASHRRLAAIVESSDDAIIAKTLDGTITDWNAGAERLYGYAAAAAIGQPFSLLVPTERANEVAQTIQRFHRGERIDHFETVRRRRDGSLVDVSVSYSPIRASDGQLVGVSVITREVTQRKRLERLRVVRQAVTQVLAEAARIDEAIPAVLQTIGEKLAWDVGAFWRLNERRELLCCEHLWRQSLGRADEFIAATAQSTFASGVGLPGRIWAAGAAAWVLNVLEDPNFPRQKIAARSGLRAAFGFPIMVNGDCLGVIEFFSGEIRAPDDDLLETMSTIGGQIGQFIERKHAEERLQHSERELADFFENASVGLHWVGPDGTIMRVNRAELELLGYRREEYIGHSITEFHVDQDVIADILRRLRAGEILRDYPAQMRAKDGSIRDVLIDSSVKWDNAEFIHTRCFTRDVTDRRQAEAAAHERQRQLEVVANNAPVLLAHCDVEGTYKFVNQPYAARFGLRPRDLIGQHLRDVLGPGVFARIEPYIQTVLAGRRVEFETEAPYHGIGLQPVLCAYQPEWDEDGRVVGFVAAITNIAERKQIEQTIRFLADASASLASLVDYQSTLQKVARLAVPFFADWCTVDVVADDGTLHRVAVAHVDPSKVELAHEVYRRFPPEPTAPQGVWNIVRTGQTEMVSEITDDLLGASVKDPELLAILQQLGLRSYLGVPLSVRGKVLGVLTFIAAESGRRYQASDRAVAEDLAHRAAVAIENAQLYANLREADRVKDEFLAMLAHELRNPLAPIRNALHILKLPAVNGALLDQAREMAERQVQHMARLLDDLLDVSRISRGRIELRREVIEVAPLVQRCVEAVRSLFDERRHQLQVSLPAEPVWLEGDPTRLEQVITNLLNNAAKYTDPGGLVRLTGTRDDGGLVLRVRDTGIGIAPEVLPHIFDLFVQGERRLDRSQGGVGIGLTLVKRLVELHGGTVQAASAGPDRGSEFTVRLPALPRAVKHEPTKLQTQIAPSSRPPAHRILVVDDNVDAADSLATLLRLGGQTVQVAYDGPAALHAAQSLHPQIVFLDIGMPGMNGYDVAQRLRRQPESRAALLVALTGWGQESDQQRSFEAGFDRHLVKPIEPSTLEAVLASVPS